MIVAAALSMGATCRAAPADVGSPTAFARWIYSHYPMREREWLPRAAEGRVFDPSLMALIRADRTSVASGDVSSTDDSDRFCQCQDDSGLVARVGAARITGSDRASASVTLRFTEERPPSRIAVVLDLVRVNGRWRVHDIRGRDEPSFRAALAADARDAAAGR
ncbi:MAG: hypothetical protein ABI056_01435 [Caulobacteraceae bacterium]